MLPPQPAGQHAGIVATSSLSQAEGDVPAEPSQAVVARQTPVDLPQSTGAPAAAATEGSGSDPHSPGYITENEEIGLVLGRWRRALLSNNAAEIAPSYADRIDRYFLQTGVNRAYVREYMETEEETGSRLIGYQLRDVAIDHVNPDEVDVRFVANFRVTSPWRESSGGARTLLKLRREEGDWKIFYERDFRS